MSVFTSPRWMPVAFATALVASVTVALVGIGSAATNEPSSFVPIVPCRLVDTRSDSQVGALGQPLGPDSTVTVSVHGSNGNCTLPANAVAIATNTTAVDPTAPSFLTLYPADASERPTSSNLNVLPSSPPTPNQVTVGLSVDGAINVYNLAGEVDVLIDVVGYFIPAGSTVIVSQPPKALQETQIGHQRMGGATGSWVNALWISLPAGKWLVNYTVTVVNFSGTSDLFRCWLHQTFEERLGLTTARVGPGADVSPFTSELIVTSNGQFSYAVACGHDGAIPGGTGLLDTVYMETAIITAVEVS